MPKWQVHEYNADFFILRESGCTHYEKPFLYLIFGEDGALLEDTGAGDAETAVIVMELISRWADRKQKTSVPLTVVHSHGHGDHTAGDAQFAGLDGVRLIPASPPELQAAFGIANWPEDIGEIDLGGRVLDIIPIPGHHAASIAIYDPRTGVLLTGDSFYPGRLYVGEADYPAFVASTRRMVDFTRDRPVAHILGTHIEQTRTPFADYPRGTAYQPDEHTLELSRGVLLELHEALAASDGQLREIALRDLTLSPR
jgi:glyoxylase-like metal-dependent hydrolase (beta-lactamase superfamily II)